MEIFKVFTFEAAHRLPHAPVGHKCERLHGHSYHIAVHVQGDISLESGWITDFADIARVVEPVIAQLDHTYLNEIDGLANPTSELLARWIWARLELCLPGLSQLVVRETCTSGCVYRGDASD